MKKYVRIFVLPHESEEAMWKALTLKIDTAACELGIPPRDLMAQFTVACSCGIELNGAVHIVYTVEFFVEPAAKAAAA